MSSGEQAPVARKHVHPDTVVSIVSSEKVRNRFCSGNDDDNYDYPEEPIPCNSGYDSDEAVYMTIYTDEKLKKEKVVSDKKIPQQLYLAEQKQQQQQQQQQQPAGDRVQQQQQQQPKQGHESIPAKQLRSGDAADDSSEESTNELISMVETLWGPDDEDDTTVRRRRKQEQYKAQAAAESASLLRGHYGDEGSVDSVQFFYDSEDDESSTSSSSSSSQEYSSDYELSEDELPGGAYYDNDDDDSSDEEEASLYSWIEQVQCGGDDGGRSKTPEPPVPSTVVSSGQAARYVPTPAELASVKTRILLQKRRYQPPELDPVTQRYKQSVPQHPFVYARPVVVTAASPVNKLSRGNVILGDEPSPSLAPRAPQQARPAATLLSEQDASNNDSNDRNKQQWHELIRRGLQAFSDFREIERTKEAEQKKREAAAAQELSSAAIPTMTAKLLAEAAKNNHKTNKLRLSSGSNTSCVSKESGGGGGAGDESSRNKMKKVDSSVSLFESPSPLQQMMERTNRQREARGGDAENDSKTASTNSSSRRRNNRSNNSTHSSKIRAQRRGTESSLGIHSAGQISGMSGFFTAATDEDSSTCSSSSSSSGSSSDSSSSDYEDETSQMELYATCTEVAIKKMKKLHRNNNNKKDVDNMKKKSNNVLCCPLEQRALQRKYQRVLEEYRELSRDQDKLIRECEDRKVRYHQYLMELDRSQRDLVRIVYRNKHMLETKQALHTEIQQENEYLQGAAQFGEYRTRVEAVWSELEEAKESLEAANHELIRREDESNDLLAKLGQQRSSKKHQHQHQGFAGNTTTRVEELIQKQSDVAMLNEELVCLREEVTLLRHFQNRAPPSPVSSTRYHLPRSKNSSSRLAEMTLNGNSSSHHSHLSKSKSSSSRLADLDGNSSHHRRHHKTKDRNGHRRKANTGSSNGRR